MIFDINTTRDISKLSQNSLALTAREITYNNFEISLMEFMPNITTKHSIIITYTNPISGLLSMTHSVWLSDY